MTLPRLALTLGDIAGIGPEITARVLRDRMLRQACLPTVIGHPTVLRQALQLIQSPQTVVEVESPSNAAASPDQIACWNPCDDSNPDVVPGMISAKAGHAAYQYLVTATRATLNGDFDGIVTAPISKQALHEAGHIYPGHTEILAQECGCHEFAMMLYLPSETLQNSPHGLGVAHVTLHTGLAMVPQQLTTKSIRDTTVLIRNFLESLGCKTPRIAVCALNPHAGEQGLFGNEEHELIGPALASLDQLSGITGPLPADTIFHRAVQGEFDGVVAMYHDQGHIAMKLIGFCQAVNVTLGLPLVRTSPSHGTAFDIAGQGQADSGGMRAAVWTAIQLIQQRHSNSK